VSPKRLLLVTHHPLDPAGGASARWRSLATHLPGEGWEVDVSSDPLRLSHAAYAARPEDRRRVDRRARLWSLIARLTSPPFALLGIRRGAMPLLTPLLVARGARRLRRRLREGSYDAVLATGPPMTALLVARAASRDGTPPLVVELRDLWAGNPTHDRRGGLLRALERWIFGRARAVIACTPEAVQDVARRHPRVADRVLEVPNGFEPQLLERRAQHTRPASERLTIIHSGTLAPWRPLRPLLDVMASDRYRSAFRLVHHGYVPPAMAEELSEMGERCEIEVAPPSSWADAVDRIADADAALIVNTTAGGDATSVPGKVYEYMALGKPVLCITEGGAAEGLLARLGANDWCARIDDPESIAAALDRLLDAPQASAVSEAALAAYDRRTVAQRIATVLDGVSGTGA
jgi:glycosyltransferase involved in cell wall biosynthesis